MAEKIYQKYKDFWADMDHPAWAHDDDKWFDKSVKEALFYLDNGGADKVLVDTGCGSGEFLVRFHDRFKKIYAIDYSPGMIDAASNKVKEKGIDHIELFVDDMLNVAKVVQEPADYIYNNGVVQYISLEQLDQYIAACKTRLKSGGKIVMMNIPNHNYRDLYIIKFFREEGHIPLKTWIKKFKQFNFGVLKTKIKKPGFQFDDGIGFWYTMEDLRKLAAKHQMNVDFYYSMIPPNGYRFHAVLQ